MGIAIRETTEKRKMRSENQKAVGLGFFFILCLVRFEIGSWITASSVSTWYRSLQKASFTPPEGYFSPIWIVLYFLMALSGWRVWCHERSKQALIALSLFAVQLALNMAWSVLFFGYREIGLAFGEILILTACVLLTTVLFWRIDKVSGVLLAPYLIWLAFAATLNGFIWHLN